MTEGQLSTVDVHSLSERLRGLAGDERNVQAEVLLHLDALDRRRGYAELGYPSLWECCLRALHLREGAAGRRIGAMRVLRRFPSLSEALREGRLSLSTLCVLGPVLTPENVDEVVERAAFRTKAETDAIAAAVKPRTAPADGVRRLPGVPSALPQSPSLLRGAEPVVQAIMPNANELPTPAAARDAAAGPALWIRMGAAADPRPDPGAAVVHPGDEAEPLRLEPPPRPASAAELRAVAEAQWSLRVTLDGETKRDLETLTQLLAHKVPNGSLAAVLKEALRCAIEKHGVRRGALEPGRKRPSPKCPPADATAMRLVPSAPDGMSQQREQDQHSGEAGRPGNPATSGSPIPDAPACAVQSPAARPTIPAEVRRQVWARDGGRCTFIARDGTPCGSQWKLELDHIQPWALGGTSTVDELRLRCRTHNLLHAEEVFGREHMERFRRGVRDSVGDSSPGTSRA